MVLDTGATESELDFPLYKTVQGLIEQQSRQDGKTLQELLIIYSHGHSDHDTGDSQFEGKPNVTIVKPNYEVNLELGDRKLSIIPAPEHQEKAIPIYDPHTKWLLTGDTFYPSYLYVKDWNDYKKSIARLVLFSNTHEVNAILGAHVEMTNNPVSITQ